MVDWLLCKFDIEKYAHFFSVTAMFRIFCLLGIAIPTHAMAAPFQPGFYAGMHPSKIVSADFNVDGIPDVAVLNSNNRISVLLGDSFYGFREPALSFSINAGARDILAADFNADAVPDLAVYTGGILSVYLGDGTGQFGASVDTSVDVPSKGITVAAGMSTYMVSGMMTPPGVADVVSDDFDGDGNTDVAFLYRGGFGIMLGNGAGDFKIFPNQFDCKSTTVLAFDPPTRLFSGVLLPNLDPGTYLGSNDKNLMPSTRRYFSVYPNNMTSADFNADGNVDLAISLPGSNELFVYLNTGSLAPGSLLPIPYYPDIMKGSPVFSVSPNNGGCRPSGSSLGFSSPKYYWPYQQGGSDLFTADINNDGKVDILVHGTGAPGFVNIRFGDGQGDFPSATAQTLLTGKGSAVFGVADFNGDGNQDFAVAHPDDTNLVLSSQHNTAHVFLGDGAGAFSPNGFFQTGSDPNGVVTGDFNNDGTLDIAVSNGGSPLGLSTTSSGSVSLLLGCFNADGTVVLCTKRGGSANFPSSGKAKDPVDTFTGEFIKRTSDDLNLGGVMSLTFSRYYASGLSAADNNIISDLNIGSHMGNNWKHNYDWHLTRLIGKIEIINGEGRVINFSRNGSSWVLSDNLDATYQLSESGSEFTLFDPQSNLFYVFLNSIFTTRLIRVEDGKGNVHMLSYSSIFGPLQQVSDGQGRSLNFSYDANDHLISVTDGAVVPRSVQFTYSQVIGLGAYVLASSTDPLGNVTTYHYDSKGMLTGWTMPAGNTPLTQTFLSSQPIKVATQTDALGNLTTFGYSNLSTIVTDALSNNIAHTHSATGELNNHRDQSGQNIVIGSDNNGRRNAITDKLGNAISSSFDLLSGKLASTTMPDGSKIQYNYTVSANNGGIQQYDLSMITYPDLTTESFAYDGLGNVTGHIDQAGNQTSSAYNTHGQLLTRMNPAGGRIAYGYNPDQTLASRADAAGNTITFAYDVNKRINLVSYPDGTSRQFTRDVGDHLLTELDGRGNTTTFTYDANGNVTSMIDGLGATTTFAYDAMDRLSSLIKPAASASRMTYDALGRLATSTNGNGNQITLGYDARGNQTLFGDGLSHSWSTAYDANDNVIAKTDPLGHSEGFSFDTRGRMTRHTSPAGNVMNVVYDAIGHVSNMTDPLGNMTTFSYDANGKPTAVVLPGSISIALTYNALGEISGITNPNGGVWIRNYNRQGLLESSIDPLGRSNTYLYDHRNRPSTVTFPAAMGTANMSYDGNGNVIRMLYSDGTDLNYTYDANDRVLTANGFSQSYDLNGDSINSNGMAIVRDSGGRIASMTLAAGKTVSYAYDANDNLKTVGDWTGATTTFSYDAADRLTSIVRANGINATFSYDNDDRLVGITEGAISNISLTRDANGQITHAVRAVPKIPTMAGSGMTSMKQFSDAASQLTGSTYDHLGRVAGDGNINYTWNLAFQLKSYSRGGNGASFTYDGLGNRLSRVSGGVSRSYVWNNALSLNSVSVERQAGLDLRYYVHTPAGELLYSIDATSNAMSYYHFDEMGNTIFMSNAAGSVIASYAYSPYGMVIASTGVLNNPFTWQGKYGVMDEGQGLYYMRARFYDAQTGRFLLRDPKKGLTPKSVNPYQYALANPMFYIDPKGTAGVPNGASKSSGVSSRAVVNTALTVNTHVTYYIGKAADTLSRRLATKALLGRLNISKKVEVIGKKAGVLGSRFEVIGKRVGKLGDAGDIIGSALVVIDTAKALNKVHAAGNQSRFASVELQGGQLDAVISLFRAKKITFAQAQQMTRAINDRSSQDADRTWGIEVIDTAIAALTGLKDTLKGITPAPIQTIFGYLGF